MSQHLSYPERCIIERLLNSGKNYAAIARQIERAKSTVMREVKKNVVVFGVNPELIKAVSDLVEKENVTTFYVGSHGNFDGMSASAVREVKRQLKDKKI